MNDREMGIVVKYIAGNWPSMRMPTETLEVYRLEMTDLPFDETLMTLRVDCADDDFAPSPMKLRNLVFRRLRGSEFTYEQAMSEMLDAISSVGRYAPEPQWSHPVLAEIVRHRGGWVEVCNSTPARAAVDAAGMSAFNTWSAQFRDHFRGVANRGDRDDVFAAITSGLNLEIESELPRG